MSCIFNRKRRQFSSCLVRFWLRFRCFFFGFSIFSYTYTYTAKQTKCKGNIYYKMFNKPDTQNFICVSLALFSQVPETTLKCGRASSGHGNRSGQSGRGGQHATKHARTYTYLSYGATCLPHIKRTQISFGIFVFFVLVVLTSDEQISRNWAHELKTKRVKIPKRKYGSDEGPTVGYSELVWSMSAYFKVFIMRGSRKCCNEYLIYVNNGG